METRLPTYFVLLALLIGTSVAYSGSGSVEDGKSPKASLKISPNPANIGEDVTFNASESSDPDNEIEKYRIDYESDGDFEWVGADDTVTTSFGSTRTETATLEVEDSNGNTDTATADYEINNVDGGGGSGGGGSGGNTVIGGYIEPCGQEPSGEACQKPYFADEQSEYRYDLGASWLFNSGQPDNSGPTVFFGGEAGNIADRYPDSASGDTKTEYYTDNPGSAENGEQTQWGFSPIKYTDITVTGSKTGNNQYGDLLITQPYQGECGDGIKNVGDEESCPEDWGTPTSISLDNQPAPNKDITYEEPSGSVSFLTAGRLDNFDSTEEISSGASKSGEPDYVLLGNSIGEETVGASYRTVWSFETHLIKEKDYSSHKPIDSSQTDTYYTSGNSSDSVNLCTSVSYVSGYYDDYNLVDGNSLTKTVSTESYEATSGTSSQSLDITARQYTGGEGETQIASCSNSETYYTNCDSNDPTTSCTEANVDHYGETSTFGSQRGQTGVDRTKTFKVLDYYIVSDRIWGPVNREPGMFDNTPVGSENIVDTNFGYHTDKDRLDIDKDNANDPAVSANKYDLIKGSSAFIAERIEFNVADADGPDGQGDGIIAYNENKGVTGTTDTFANQETWNGIQQDYISKSDIGRVNCPSGTEKCVKTVDLSTAQSGWGSNYGNSFKIR